MRLSRIEELIAPYRLLVLGHMATANVCRVLVGNAGSEFWNGFTRSPEYSDKKADPLDRWSKRVGGKIAEILAVRIVYPFEGPPYLPFLQWAAESGQVFGSPVSISIHGDYGLWHAYRFALELDGSLEGATEPEVSTAPCKRCEDKPCIGACPVNAFGNGLYDVKKCMDFLQANEQSACRLNGCEARRACPYKKTYRYQPYHAQFHMNAFVNSAP